MEISKVIQIPGLIISVLKFWGLGRYTNRIKAKEFIRHCLNECEKIIHAESLPTDETSFSHEVIKKYYRIASSIVGGIVSKNDLEKIMQALSAARIYYWLRVFDGKNSLEINELIKERKRRILSYSVRNNSCEYVIQKFGIGEYTTTANKNMISLARDNCLADIAELKELKVTYIN